MCVGYVYNTYNSYVSFPFRTKSLSTVALSLFLNCCTSFKLLQIRLCNIAIPVSEIVPHYHIRLVNNEKLLQFRLWTFLANLWPEVAIYGAALQPTRLSWTNECFS